MSARSAKKTDIRPASLDDLSELLRLERACFTGIYADHRFDQEQFEYYLNQRTTIMCIGEYGDSAVAYILGIVGTGNRKHIARIHSIAVLPEFRRRGYAELLLVSFLAAARMKGCTECRLEVATRKAGAIRLFEKHEFEVVRRLQDYYGKGRHGQLMKKDLKA